MGNKGRLSGKNGRGKVPHCDIIIRMEKVMKQVKLYIVVEKNVHN